VDRCPRWPAQRRRAPALTVVSWVCVALFGGIGLLIGFTAAVTGAAYTSLAGFFLAALFLGLAWLLVVGWEVRDGTLVLWKLVGRRNVPVTAIKRVTLTANREAGNGCSITYGRAGRAHLPCGWEGLVPALRTADPAINVRDRRRL
jgi:hypothetical protein